MWAFRADFGLRAGFPAPTCITDTASPARTVLFTYDGNSNLIQVQDARGGQTQFTYDASHQLLTMKDPNCVNAGNACDGIRNTYVNGQVNKQIDNLNRITTFSYQSTAIGTTTTTTDPKGNVTVDEYANNVLLDETRGQGSSQQATWNYGFDAATLGQTSVTDPNGHTVVMTRDNQANVLAKTDALGRTTSSTFNSFNEPLVVTDPLGVATTNTYDSNGNLSQTSTPLVGSSPAVSKTTVYTYGDVNHPGDVTQITDPDGKLWTYTYTANGDQASATDPLSDKTTYGYDGVGRMTSKVTPKGNVSGGNPSAYTWSYAYNAFNQRTSVADPLSHTTSYQYDPNGNLSLVTDANSNQTSYAYDLDNELTTETDGLGSAVQRTQQTTYDADGNVYQQVDGNLNVTAYGYDALNRKTSSSDPLHRVTTYAHDAAGNVTSMVDAKAQTTSYSYDSGDQLASIGYSDPSTPNVAYSYDGDGQRLSMADGTGTSTYSYDSLHRLTQTTNGAGSQLQYGYDLKGQMTSLKYPGGSNQVSRTYDDSGRLATVADWLSHTTSFHYDPNSNLTEQDYPNTAVACSTYDAADRLTSIVDTTAPNPSCLTGQPTQFLAFTYGRDNAGQLTSDSGQSYGYDALNRVTSAPSTAYQFDAADQLTQTAVTGGNTTSLSYDIAGQLKTSTVTNGPTQVSKLSFSFDANGNRIRSIDQNNVNTIFSYDSANRLTNFNSTGSYMYNGDGLRMSKTASGSTSAQTWSPIGGLPSIVADAGSSYVLGPSGLPIEQITGSTVYYFHQDQLGSTRALTDSAGTVQQTYSFDIWGNQSSASGSILNPFRFAGQYLDSESGLYYLRARFYDPSSGQFITRDPIFAKTRAAYGYVQDSPLNGADPSGLLNWGAGWNALVQGVSSLRPTENNDLNFDAWNPLDTGYLLQQNAQELSNPNDWGSANAYRVATDDAKFGFALGATYCGARALAFAAEASGFSEWAAGNSVLGRAGPIFGRGGTGVLNNNNYLRLGWGWKGPAQGGKEVFRLVMGSRKLPFGPWHIP